MTPTIPPDPRSDPEGAAQVQQPAPAVDILGVQIDAVDFAATLDRIDAWVALGRCAPVCRQICTVNPEFIMDARRDPEFAATLAAADLRVPDGIGILWAARLQGVALTERVTGSDGIYRIAQAAAAAGWRIFLLGAGPGVAAQTAQILAIRYPGLQVCGVHQGSPAEEEWPAIRALLAQAAPDILFVAFGHPRQDLWIGRHRHELPAAVALGVGGAFDFVVGVQRRAPVWVQQLGLEWLYRLVREPWRWRRMAKLPRFVLLVLRRRLRG